jgi:hypothetical protein
MKENLNYISSVFDLATRLVADPSTSYWLRNAIQTSMARDPVDSVNDAELLLSLLSARLEEIQSN